MKLRLTLAAEQDIEHIRDTVTTESPIAAVKIQRSIARAVALLSVFPNMRRTGQVQGTREKTVKSLLYVIVYAVDETELVILRIYHGVQKRG